MKSYIQYGIRYLLLSLVLCGIMASPTKASHVAAGDIYMDYIGHGPSNLKYLVTLVVYKVCEPNNADLSSYRDSDI